MWHGQFSLLFTSVRNRAGSCSARLSSCFCLFPLRPRPSVLHPVVMAGKTLSNGTLSLRFMQNAHRAKQQAQVEAEQRKIKDEAEWEVSKEIKEAWGIGSKSQTEQNVAYEASYLPFLFPSTSDGAEPSSSTPSHQNPVVRGRRTFNHRGQEVVHYETPTDNEGDKKVNIEEKDAEKPRPKRLVAISGFRAPAQDAKKPRSKTAQMLIREDALVRPPSALAPLREQGSGFVKPPGFDDLPSTSKAGPSLKRDRQTDAAPDPRTSEAKKRKKKEKETS
ncbi:hypothetical protein OBBRIDRAFT_428845 [Obba rivulosa]|uniref:Uncharacterized protein n=1 Tax=Obba rivulosa TaxID=1052685 RepID=A0A8E2B0M0_9APHY|nr:hypothetical protein OBBRIDRAFT_428845 [Obba rivulosa]